MDDAERARAPREEPAPGLRQVRALAERVARSHGFEIFDVQQRREPIGLVLRVIIDRPAPEVRGTEEVPVGITDCQQVSQDLSALLDVEDVVEGKYVLEVSSPGLDRPLRGPSDYSRFAGRLAKMVLTTPVDGQKHFRGRLRGLEGEQVLVEDDRGGVHAVPLSVISRARLEVEF